MTPLSWRAPRAGASLAGKPVPKGLAAPWHAACCLFAVSGCFYLGPMPTLENNMPPELVTAAVEPQEPILVVRPEGQAMYVIAEDPDDDDIAFSWILSGDGVINDSTPINTPLGEGSQIYLERDEGLDGQELRCLMGDGRELVMLIWPVEVP